MRGSNNVRTVVLLAVLMAGCFGSPPETVPEEEPDALREGSAHWSPVGDFSWDEWSKSEDGTRWTFVRTQDAASSEFLQAFIDREEAPVRLARGGTLMELDNALLVSWTVQGAEGAIVETAVFAGDPVQRGR